MNVSLLFTNSADIFSRAIRVATWSRWSHVALVDGDRVIEAYPQRGVQIIDTDEVARRSREYALVDLPCREPEAVLSSAASQSGKPYDYTAIVGLGLHRDWQEDDAWFCSELVAWAFAQAGEPLFRDEAIRRVTPQHLWMLAPFPASPAPVLFPQSRLLEK